MTYGKSPIGKFKATARELNTEGDPECFKERLATLVKHKPVPEKGE